MSEEWQMTAYYGPEAPELWRRKHPKARSIGPRPGEVAIQVQGSRSVVDMDVEVARARPDIGEVVVIKL